MVEVKGWYAYKGLVSQQHEDIEEVFPLLLEELRPARVLEIGTSYGGLTLLMRDMLDEAGLEDTPLITYDIMEKNTTWLKDKISEGINIEYRLESIFNKNYDDLFEEKKQEVRDFFNQPGNTLVLCDGGSKINEFNILSDYIKKGDVIMAHDYAPNRDFWNRYLKNKVWNWLEIQDSHIQEAVERNNLKPYFHEEFVEVVWVCKIKE